MANSLGRSHSHSWRRQSEESFGSMRAKHRIRAKLSRRTRGQASTITRRRKTTSRTRLWLKKRSTLPFTAATTDPAIKRWKHLIRGRALTSISIIQYTARCNHRSRTGTKRSARSKRNKALSWDHLDRTPTDSSNHGWIPKVGPTQASTRATS